MKAIYVCRTADGTVRWKGSTEMSVEQIKAGASAAHQCDILDVIEEHPNGAPVQKSKD